MYNVNGDYFGGYVPDVQANRNLIRSLPHKAALFEAAPHFIGDGAGQDLMPYKAFREIEIFNPDGSVWKSKGDEPPYIPQTGNNCTSEGLMHVVDLLQAMDIADPIDNNIDVFQRTCVEATYAFGLYKAGMRGDNGCSGSGMAQGGTEIGFVSYYDVAPPYDEVGSRLKSWANNPKSVVDKYSSLAAPRKLPAPVQITTTQEAEAWLANRGLFTIASNRGFATPRDAKGICQHRSRWDHQMMCAGRIVSDGVPTFVIVQSWGKNQPNGATPFDLLTFSFRITDAELQIILDQQDTWGFRQFAGFKKTPLPNKWTYGSWS